MKALSPEPKPARRGGATPKGWARGRRSPRADPIKSVLYDAQNKVENLLMKFDSFV
jgi:hypothetical protein